MKGALLLTGGPQVAYSVFQEHTLHVCVGVGGWPRVEWIQPREFPAGPKERCLQAWSVSLWLPSGVLAHRAYPTPAVAALSALVLLFVCHHDRIST